MKFKLGEIRNMKDPMIKLLDKEIPIKTAWRLNKLVKNFDKELNDIEEFRVGLVRKLGVAEEGNEDNLTVPPEKMEEFVEKFNELLNQEVEYEFEPIDLEEFGDVHFNTKDLAFLEKLFC